MFEGSSFGQTHLESSFSTNKSMIKSNKKMMMNTTITTNTNKARVTIPKARIVMLDDTTTMSAT